MTPLGSIRNKLSTYRKKRFAGRRAYKTKEPKGTGFLRLPKKPLFCIQKHAASHLHYDLRLEHHGVLLSWAVPKGAPAHFEEKRLAIRVEDHPFAYHRFEGTIPKGHYGAGKVEIWDEGTYFFEKRRDKKETAKAIDAGLKKGHLNLIFHGKKIKGAFSLIKMKGKDKELWLWMKQKNDRKKNGEIKDKKKETTMGLPSFFKPMLATLVEAPFKDPNWIFEIKWDGYRTLAYCSKQNVVLYSRNGNTFNALFPKIAKELSLWKVSCILDGEIVALDKKGLSHFQLLQNYQRTKEDNIYYYVFDLLYCNKEDLRSLPLIERKMRLQAFLATCKSPFIRYNDHIEQEGMAFFKQAKRLGLEGMIAKKKTSVYSSSRSKDWLKIKTTCRQEAVIIGFTLPKGTRPHIGALLLGVHLPKQTEMAYVGRVGTGFSLSTAKDLLKRLTPLIRMHPPCKGMERVKGTVTWVYPQLVCEVSFSEWTQEGRMRHPVFEGLRIDKKAADVKKETPS